MTARGSSSTVHSRSLTVDHTQVPSTQTNFPVLVSFTNSTLKTITNGGHVQNVNGYDIVFTSDSVGVTRLKWEMEFYDPANGIVVAWVKIASLSSASDTVFYMFYGDASITTDQSDKANTWDSNASFRAVWHLSDNAANTTILASKGTNAINVANTSTKTVTGQIYKGLTYNGTSDGSSSAFDLSITDVITLSFWLKWTTNGNNDALAFEYTPNYNGQNAFIVDASSSTAGGSFEFGMSLGANYWLDQITSRPSAGAWHLYHLVIDRDTPVNKAYVDGSSAPLTTTNHSGFPGPTAFDNSTLYFMSRNKASLFGDGLLEEVHLASVERSGDWATCEWNNQKTSSTFVALGAET